MAIFPIFFLLSNRCSAAVQITSISADKWPFGTGPQPWPAGGPTEALVTCKDTAMDCGLCGASN